MQAALNAFEASMLRVRALHALHGSFSKQVTAAIDLSDLLRAEIVLGVMTLPPPFIQRRLESDGR